MYSGTKNTQKNSRQRDSTKIARVAYENLRPFTTTAAAQTGHREREATRAAPSYQPTPRGKQAKELIPA